MTERSEKRTEFLKDLLVTAVETYGYTPWFQFGNYDPDNGTVDVYTWKDDTDDEETGNYSDGPYPVDLDKLASALGKYVKDVMALQNPHKTYAYQLVLADRTNGDEGDFDVTTADSVLQIAVFGKEIYG
jgi:hypothetical protein